MKATPFNQKTIDEFNAKHGLGVGRWGDHVLLMTAQGAKSGEAITTPLVYGREGDDYIIVASKGGAPKHPTWFGNIKANPEVEVEVAKARGTEKFKARARVVDSRQERDRLYKEISKIWPSFAEYETRTERLISASFLSAMFFLLPLLLMAFAVTQVSLWAADEQDGRLDLVLSTPQPRLQVLLGRFAALGSATVVIGVITLLASAGAAAVTGLQLDSRNLAAATLGMIPLGLLIAAIGYLASGWLRTAADTGLVSFLLVIWFFISFIGPELKLPDATLRLSAFYYYGTPLLHGLQLTSVLAVVAVTAIALGLGALRFMRKDIAT